MNPSSNLSADYRPYSGGRPAWAVADGASDSGRDLEDQYESDLVEHRADVIPEPERTGCWYSFTRVIRISVESSKFWTTSKDSFLAFGNRLLNLGQIELK
ncbi:uncharacterized protein CDAR_470182 [Caerostris darwini]|uniref:Uncharacterized protein n=1 Tax=Caerostris darwini TaxID=1538125 RepID=A0AAV4VL70_9ARAC|nr:uncharacterized protein CDAR_470182 [Caerostris darwini]